MWGSRQVAGFLDVRYRTLDSWLRTGLLSCICPGNGTGNRRGWSAADVTRAVTVNELRAGGYSLQAIRKSEVVDKLTDEAIVSGVVVCTVGKIIGVVPEFDPDLKTWKQCVDCDDSLPVTVGRFRSEHLSHDLPLNQQSGMNIYVTDIYEEVKHRMEEGTAQAIKMSDVVHVLAVLRSVRGGGQQESQEVQK